MWPLIPLEQPCRSETWIRYAVTQKDWQGRTGKELPSRDQPLLEQPQTENSTGCRVNASFGLAVNDVWSLQSLGADPDSST